MRYPVQERVKSILKSLTLKQKARLLYGKDFWYVRGSEADKRLPDIMLTDGPSGLRKQEGKADMLGIHAGVPATAFPTASCLACSWDEALVREMGEAMARECVKEGVSVLLGPGVNHKRDPLCGRNFEYFSEDPFLTGKLAAGLVQGVQSLGIGTSLKHFAANSREDERMFSDSMVDERTLHEIYLKQFEMVIRQAQPRTVMMAYNKLNGVHCAENERLMKLAREEWGFQGIFLTDWGAMRRQTAAYAAGLDLEMPGTQNSDEDLCEAVEKGEIAEAVIDEHAARMIEFLLDCNPADKKTPENLLEKNFEIACNVAAESTVLLKNESILPLCADSDFCVIGGFAKTPRYQGGGSSHVNAWRVTNFLDQVKGAPYAEGYRDNAEETDEAYIRDAVRLAASHENVIVFAGLPERMESEGFDRKDMELPQAQLRLIKEIAAVNQNIVVVLQLGAPVTLPFLRDVKAVLLTYLAGEGGGKATYELLFGRKNPCGKLAETFPVCYEDTPSHRYYKKHEDYDEYREGIFTGYRYYETADVPVNFPFGHGLSYTTFSYCDVSLDRQTLFFTLKNTGDYDGKEIAQVYLSALSSKVSRPKKELKAFRKVALAAGEAVRIAIPLSEIDFSFYNRKEHRWQVEEGDYELLIGASVADIRLRARLHVTGETVVPEDPPCYTDMTAETIVSEADFLAYAEMAAPHERNRYDLTLFSPIGDLKYSEKGRQIYQDLKARVAAGGEANLRTAMDMPIINMTMGGHTRKEVQAFLENLRRN